MKEPAERVKLSTPFDIDSITIRRDHYFPNAYVVDLPLDSMPDHIWQAIFERKWKSSRHLWDRKLFVIGRKLRLVSTADDFGEKLDWIEQVIQETNKGIEEYNLAVQKEEEIRVKEQLKKQVRWEEKAGVEVLKEILRKRYT